MRSLRAFLHLATQGVYSDFDTDGVGQDEKEIKDKNDNLHASDLPRPNKSSYSTATAQFFQDGGWLLDISKVETNLDNWKDKYGNMGKAVIATTLLKDQDWFIFINEENDNQSKCEVKDSENKHTTGRRWVNGMCGDLWVFLDDDPDTVGAEAAQDEEKSKFDSLQSTAAVDLADM